jgi:hypothetical protein
VESAGDARQDVLTLRQSLEVIRGDVRRAVEVGEQLEVEGQPLDVHALVARVVELEQLRERLRLPSGALLDAAALELRLTELTTTLVTEEELDEAIRNALLAPLEALQAQVQALQAQVQALQAQVQALQGQVRRLTVRVTRLEERVGPDPGPGPVIGVAEPAAPELERLVTEQVDRAANRLRANVRDQVRRDLDRRQPQLRELVAEVVEERLAR